MSKHDLFIKTPIENVLEDAVSACRLGLSGMESYPLCDYFIHSLLLKMTGFSEQKLKCILWELASDDYEFRYELLRDWKYGECSNLKDKNDVLRKIVGLTHKNGVYNKDLEKMNIMKESIDYCKTLLDDCLLKEWLPRQYENFLDFTGGDYSNQFFVGSNAFFANKENISKNEKYKLSEIYKHLYNQRNRSAHNLLSYQVNLPTLRILSDKDFDNCENWFIWFALLVAMDRLIIELYKDYKKSLLYRY